MPCLLILAQLFRVVMIPIIVGVIPIIVGVAVTRSYVVGVVDTLVIVAKRRKLLNSAGDLQRHLNAPNYPMEIVTILV
jgi:hypothetical protein